MSIEIGEMDGKIGGVINIICHSIVSTPYSGKRRSPVATTQSFKSAVAMMNRSAGSLWISGRAEERSMTALSSGNSFMRYCLTSISANNVGWTGIYNSQDFTLRAISQIEIEEKQSNSASRITVRAIRESLASPVANQMRAHVSHNTRRITHSPIRPNHRKTNHHAF